MHSPKLQIFVVNVTRSAMLVYIRGTPIWRPEYSVNIWNLLWLSRRLTIKTKQTSIYISTFPGSCVFCAPLDRHIGRHIDRHSTDVSVDISTDTRPMYRPRYVGRHIDRYIGWDVGRVSVDISADISVDIAADAADILTIDCRWNIGRLSVVYRSTVV